jgi:hypothetical protein
MPNRDGKGPDGKGPRRRFREEFEDEESCDFKRKNRDRKRKNKNVYKKYINSEEEE